MFIRVIYLFLEAEHEYMSMRVGVGGCTHMTSLQPSRENITNSVSHADGILSNEVTPSFGTFTNKWKT